MYLTKRLAICALVLAPLMAAVPAFADEDGRITGSVAMLETGDPIRGASVLVVELGDHRYTDSDGKFEFDSVHPGRYHVVSRLGEVLTGEAQVVEVAAGGVADLTFHLEVAADHYEITVTATEHVETAFSSLQSVESMDSHELATLTASSLGEVLDHRVGTGIAKRSFGPGSARPIIRGFDGDRVLIMQDGIRTGTLSSASGDHGELINPSLADRIEVVKGPATLLYSGNATGGTVNVVSRHEDHHRFPREGVRGHVSASGGTTNALAGTAASFEAGAGRWVLWGSGSGLRAGDYTAPGVGEVFNSRNSLQSGAGGVGWYGDKTYLTFQTEANRGWNGIPFASEFHGAHGHGHEDEHEGEEEHEDHAEGEEEEDHEEEGHEEEEELERVALRNRRDAYRVTWGLRNLGGPIEGFTLKLSQTNWHHDEFEYFHDGDSAIGTTFDNEQLVYRGVFEQSGRGALSGRFGFWGIDRDYSAVGEEALSPPVHQRGLALFAFEQVDLERFKLQFGARIETQRYRPAYAERGEHEEDEEEHEEEGHHEEGEEEEGEEHHEDEHHAPDAIDRTFTGASAAIGIRADTWRGGAFVANLTRSFRAPSLEELYNFGPHVGSLAFEVGNPNLESEVSTGADFSLRHQSERGYGEVNVFYYGFENFVFPFATGEEVDGLGELEFIQRDARFVGTEANLGIHVVPGFTLTAGMDYVDARETMADTPLPRIPPLRGRFGFDCHIGGLHLEPELVLAAEQNRTFDLETPTAAYAVVNLRASYTVVRNRVAHQFAVNVFNIGDQLYRNHSSFIKDLAPEIGRGIRATYVLRFF